ncbi:hypothetical protein CN311_01065 [Mesorhizobium sanjuanii]|uniref:YjiS-like domain-containing protein n=1 Tax=Mesorhizobium sanjuanii TaxID=2037900 RepID=A0A2A6FM86_9HYPH|nr:DUF1127 domain-containing protein [Mesorhizobium sanjuanii]PDQ22944.1 hypothetical protein CN311_01065 [Mesorhizobium sanjuanii]
MRNLFALAPTAFEALLSRSRARRDAGRLDGFSDAQLKDIGISRGDIDRVVRSHMTKPAR